MSEGQGRKQFLTDDYMNTSNMQYFVDDHFMGVYLTSDSNCSFELFTSNHEEFCEQIDSIINFLVETKRAASLQSIKQEDK